MSEILKVTVVSRQHIEHVVVDAYDAASGQFVITKCGHHIKAGNLTRLSKTLCVKCYSVKERQELVNQKEKVANPTSS